MKDQPPKKRQSSLRVAYKYQQVQQDILTVAQGILAEGGTEALTLASVAGNLGMTKQALYHYFPSKEMLARNLVTTLVDKEIETIIAAIEDVESVQGTLSTLIRTFYQHYAVRIEAFRFVYCQSQLYSTPVSGLDEDTIRNEINPRTRQLFDLLEEKISPSDASRALRKSMRELAFSAWLSALGLVTMLSVADAVNDPLVHSDEDLLESLSKVFERAAVP